MKGVSAIVTAVICASSLISSEQVRSEPVLQITEMWPGGLPGVDATSDWFELTNFGDAPATAIDGNLFYDDNSDDPLSADPMVGIDTIAPGESVVYLVAWENPFNNVQEDALSAFTSMWSPKTELQVGTVAFGGGLGGQGDAVNIFDGNTIDANTVDRDEYIGPTNENSFVSDANGNWIPLVSEVGVLGAYRGNFPADDMGAPSPVGSPGVVPEPTGVSLLGLGMLLSFVHARRKSRRCV